MMRRFMLWMAAALGLTAFEVEHNAFWGQRATLHELLPVDSTTIVFLGNSLTNGCEWHELLGMPNVVNRGISGDIIPGLMDRLDPIVAGKPAKIFVMCGVNDLSHNLTTDSIAHDMDLLLERIQTESPSTKIYLQSLLPFNMNVREWKTLVGKEQQTREINARYKEIAERRGITWIDLYPLVVDDNGNLREEFTNDGLHLLGPAYLIWRDAVMPYVKE